jgi:uncharacterized protein
MAEPVTINLRHVARGLGIPLGQVQAAVELLDEGNTVPFVTRYRKDQTGGLDEEQIRQIQARLTRQNSDCWPSASRRFFGRSSLRAS